MQIFRICRNESQQGPLSSREASLCYGKAGEKEKESARGTMGRGKREERPHVVNIYEEHLLDPVFLGS